jgi:hypothetical protein
MQLSLLLEIVALIHDGENISVNAACKAVLENHKDDPNGVPALSTLRDHATWYLRG